MTVDDFIKEWRDPSPTVTLHTSGSTGAPKLIEAEKIRMEASARLTLDFFGLRAGDKALLCMSPDYIAGKMMIVRSIIGGLRLSVAAPSGHPLRDAGDEGFDFAAMVAMQVVNSLADPVERRRLERIRHLVIGGGPIHPALSARLRDMPNAVWSTYGMTETLSHVALRRLSGPDASDWYSPLPSVEVWLADDGCLVVNAPRVCASPVKTNDMAELSDKGFRLLGRKDNVICSAGLKIRIEEVEDLLSRRLDCQFMITKRPDRTFGEAVAILFSGSSVDEVENVCAEALPKYYRPKYYIKIDTLPMTPTGKPARAEAMRIAAQCDS